jgi:hypothetical protein
MPIDAAPDVAPVMDAAPDRGPIVHCLSCVQQMCGQQIVMCLTDTQCRMTLQCAVQNCFMGGGAGFDPQCLLQKCGQNLAGFAQVLAVVTCVTGKCGEPCISLLGGMGMMDIVPDSDAGP